MSCINYFLGKLGYKLQIQNVADDEENATGVPSGEVIEWNVIDNNFIQNDYPTATKLMPSSGTEIIGTLKMIVNQCGLFDDSKFAGLKNPFTELLNDLDAIKRTTGSVSSSITTKIYSLLDRLNFKVICIAGED
jgi:hypothetical protein